MSDARRMTLIRHGESVSNFSKRWQGQGDSALSELGVAQARALGERLAGRAYTRVLSSDLERAQATTRALARPFETDARFRELDVGAWEGLTRQEVEARFPEQLARLAAGEDVAIGGGESYAAFCARLDRAFGQVLEDLAPGEHALIVCHGGVIGALVAGALGLRANAELPLARALNTSICELSYDPWGCATLHVFNDTLHLAGLSLFPHPLEMLDTIALLSDGAALPAFGSFAAHYDLELGLSEHALDVQVAALPFLELARGLRANHPERAHRIALSARAMRVHAWVHELLGERDGHGQIVAPRPGSLCHVSVGDQRHALVDYGVSV